MLIDIMMETGGEKPNPYVEGMDSGPAIFDENVTVAQICIGPEHMKRIKALKPGTKITVTLRGEVHSFEEKAQDGYGANTGKLCLYATEFHSSRGSEYDELLEED